LTRSRIQSRGFTLIELILVMVIISIALGYAAPSLRGWGQGQKLRNAADEFVAATGTARSLAVSDAAIYALEINPGDNTYSIKLVDQVTGAKTDPTGPGAGTKAMPESC
jgi:prepilin-type N-terminal cleavage/methylation domain-containing protein